MQQATLPAGVSIKWNDNPAKHNFVVIHLKDVPRCAQEVDIFKPVMPTLKVMVTTYRWRHSGSRRLMGCRNICNKQGMDTERPFLPDARWLACSVVHFNRRTVSPQEN